jgi:hypothetical protein
MRSRKSVPMPLWKRCGSGDASTSMPKAGPALLLLPVRSGSNASDNAMALSSSQFTASKPELTPQYGWVSDEAKVLAS